MPASDSLFGSPVGSLELMKGPQMLCRVLVTGATGYVGGRLLRMLEARGSQMRCLARRPEHLIGRVAETTEVVAGDVLDRTSLTPAMAGMEILYYLVHAMGSPGSLEEEDRSTERNVGEAACVAGVRRIIYLGGLGDRTQPLSPHLRSRQEVGEILRASGVETIASGPRSSLAPG